MIIEKYLKAIQDENVSSSAGMGFAIDSYTSKRDLKKKKKKIVRVAYPNEAVGRDPIMRRAMIDLDGTIHRYSKGYQDGSIYDDPFEGARETINWLRELDYEIVIFTARASKWTNDELGQDYETQMKNVENWLSENDIYYDKVTAEKLAADFYIDDKAIYIKNGNWVEVRQTIKERFNY
jgi:hypothetical protein